MTRRNIVNRQSGETHAFDPSIPDVSWQGEENGIDVRYYLSLFLRRRWIVLITVCVVFALGMASTYTKKSMYESSAKIVVIGNQSVASTAENDIPLLNDLQALTRNRSVDTQVEIMSSPDLLDEAFSRLSPSMQSSGFKSKGIPGWACIIASKKDTDIISVTTKAYTPSAAAELANTIADTYFKRNLQQDNLAVHQARKYVEQRMAFAEKALSKANASLAEFKKRTGFFAPETQLTRTAEQIADMSMNLNSAKADVVSGKNQIQALRSEMAGERQNVITNTTVTRNPHFETILDKINFLYSDRAALLQEFTPNSSEVKSIDNRIKLEQEKLKHITETLVSAQVRGRNPVRDALLPQYASNIASVAASGGRVSALEVALAEKQQSSLSLPEFERQYTEHIQRVTLLQRTFEMLSTKYHTLLLSEQSTLPNGMLVAKARIPGGAVYPNPKKDATLYLLLGVLLSVIVMAIVEWLDNRIHEQTQIEAITDLSILSTVPLITNSDDRLLSNNRHNGATLESFRILRNNIAFSNIDRNIKIIAVTSPGSGDGKTTVSVNLAAAMAMEGKRVILVDGDLRRPSLHEILRVPRSFGITTVLTGASRLENTIVRTSIENVSCLNSGPIPPNTTEILNSKQSKELFKTLAESYDMVIVDCPPCVGLSDVQVISTIVDGILMVVSLNKTLRPHLQLAMRILDQIEAPLIGCVINRIETHRGYGNYYYYGDHYNNTKDDDPQDTPQTVG